MRHFFSPLIFVLALVFHSYLENQEDKRGIILEIRDDCIAESIYNPQFATLDGKDIRYCTSESYGMFKPGIHELCVRHTGFEEWKEVVTIPPGREPFVIKCTLISKFRTVLEKISFDLPPGDEVPCQTTIATQFNEEVRQFREGDRIKPGCYVFRLSRAGYETKEMQSTILPSDEPYILDHCFIARPRIVQLHIVLDVKLQSIWCEMGELQQPDAYSFFLLDKMAIARKIHSGDKIKPGTYCLDMDVPGYILENQREIKILPGEQPYTLSCQLSAKPRKLAFLLVDESTRVMVPPYEILIDGKPLTSDIYFKPGLALNIVVKVKQYETFYKTLRVPPGEDRYTIFVPLKKLIFYEFLLDVTEKTFDGITYPYQFYAKSRLIESHHVAIEKLQHRTFYNVCIWVEPDTKIRDIRITAGYLYNQLSGIGSEFGRGHFSSIDISSFIAHLERVAKTNDTLGHLASLEAIEKMLQNSPRYMLKGEQKIFLLIQYIQGWNFDNLLDQRRKEVVLKNLERIVQE